MNKSDFYYELPKEQIAQVPLEPRDSSKMLVYDRKTEKLEHKHFYDVIDYLTSNDVLVINTTKVIPARIFGECGSGTRKVEFLLHQRNSIDEWEALTRPAKKAKVGTIFNFGHGLSCEVLELGEMGNRKVKFSYDGVFEDVLEKVGQMPLPPYIHDKLEDKSRYQTVYADKQGSSAAPTAGLHFTPELMDKIKSKGVEIVEVMLHVGLGTFRPLKADNILDHKMHSEYYEISESTANSLNNAKNAKKRIICVGTTSVRVLESAVKDDGTFSEASGFTDIFIYPPYKFKSVDALITNFHLPESTLIMLVSALCGREQTLNFYQVAIDNNYRFFSFGDACLIL